MRGMLILLVLISCMAMQASALELAAPEVPEAGREWMPEDGDSFGDGLMDLLEKGMSLLVPEVKNAAKRLPSNMEFTTPRSLLRHERQRNKHKSKQSKNTFHKQSVVFTNLQKGNELKKQEHPSVALATNKKNGVHKELRFYRNFV